VIVPSRRLIVLVAAIGFPLAVAAGLSPWLAPLAAGIAALFFAVAVIDASFSRNRLAAVEVRVAARWHAYLDRPQKFTIGLHSPHPLARLRLGVDWPAQIEAVEERVVSLPGGSAVEIGWEAIPRRRGDITISHFYLECPSGLGLWDIRRAAVMPVQVQVFPNLQRAEDVLALRRQMAGLHHLRQVGRGREFEKLREYLPGDGFDEIHWKATARRGRPVTKVFQVERTREVYVAVDHSRLTGRACGSHTRLERYVNTALVLGAAVERHGDLFGLVTFSDRLGDFVPAGKGPPHRAACRQALYRLEPRPVSSDYDEIASDLCRRIRGRALVLFLTDLDDPAAAETFPPAALFLAKKHLAVAAMIQPVGAKRLFSERAASVDEIYSQLSGHLTWTALKQTERRLRQSGIQFGVFGEDSLSLQVTGLYDEIKQRQAL
jgi:uncharacterized protein (DUF58 family)